MYMRVTALLLLFLVSCLSYSQAGISGYITLDDTSESSKSITLSSIDLADNKKEKQLGQLTVKSDGYFEFSKKYFNTKNSVYKIELEDKALSAEQQKLQNNKHYKLFILSNRDTLKITKSSGFLEDYTTTNKADKEWQRFRNFKDRYKNLENSAAFLKANKSYVKDSLQILMVKLISIRQLKEKELLLTDVKKNTQYYLELLIELKSSELDAANYLFLENLLLRYTKEQTTANFNISLGVNILFFMLLLMFGVLFMHFKRKNNNFEPVIPLSKQELVVKQLIETGKSNKEIATELFVSLSTVKSHITNIYAKLHISNRSELMVEK